MRSFAIACGVLMLFAATASAGDLAVSKNTLGSMGLGGMQTLSDSDGMAVRGKGTFSNVWGGSSATFNDQHAENFYEAGSSWLGYKTSAGGNSLSFAAEVEILFAADSGPQPGNMQGFALQVHAIGAIAGGSANAWAK
jgi:hypothetical protein